MNIKSILYTFFALIIAATLSLAGAAEHKTGKFEGTKANTGYAIHTTQDGKSVLKVSDDFVIPNTRAQLAGRGFERQYLSPEPV
ncbi:MAG TPA: hypothetical protein VIT91_15445 [Chthoniobacterales bacterium]